LCTTSCEVEIWLSKEKQIYLNSTVHELIGDESFTIKFITNESETIDSIRIFPIRVLHFSNVEVAGNQFTSTNSLPPKQYYKIINMLNMIKLTLDPKV
jgi:hypothetical protein